MVAPVDTEPAHSEHFDVAVKLEKDPEPQAVQLVAPAAEYVPAGHGLQNLCIR